MDNTRCKEQVYEQGGYGSFRGHQCSRKIWKDDYCKIHHPDTVAERQAKSEEKWRAKQAQSPYVKLQEAYTKIEELEEKIKELETLLNDI